MRSAIRSAIAALPALAAGAGSAASGFEASAVRIAAAQAMWESIP